jgi:hypothetical protein
MSIHRRGLWLGSAHHAASSNRAMLPPGPVPDSSKSVKSTTDFGARELGQNTAALVPVGCEARSFAGQASDEFFDYTRSASLNTDPLAGSLATVTSSPIIRASFRQIARPSPVPPSAESELALRFRQGLRLNQQTLSFVAVPALAEAHGARRSPGHAGVAVVSSRELDEQAGSVGASLRSASWCGRTTCIRWA